MAINPNIALGVQPVQQQPNMLAQYAQIMGIKAAQQEMEGNEGVRGALSQGVPDDPTTLLQYGKQGRATYESLLKGKKEQIDSAAKTLTMAGQIAGFVRDNPTPENFVSAVGTMVQSGVLTRAQAERVIADAGNDPTKIKSYAERTVSDALTEADRLTARTRLQAANIGAGPGYMNAQLNRERFNQEQERERSIQNVLADQVGPQGEPPSNVNALTGGGDVQQRVAQIDSRIQQLVGLGTPDALRAADVLFKQRNVLSPSTGAVPGTIQEFNLAKQQGFTGTFMDFQKERAALNAYGQPQEVTRKLEDGTSVTELVYPNPVKQTITPLSNLVRTEAPQGAGGGAPVQTPATAGKMQLKEEGRENVEIVLDSLYDRYANLAKEGGITDTSKGTLANIKARAGASAAGQLVGSYTGSKEQEFRDSILQTRPLLLNAIKNATGMSAQQLNSNVELQTYLAVSTDPTKSIQSNIEAMNNISKMFGLKKKFEMPSSAKSSSASATIEAPKDLPADIRELWKYMTPEDRKLWK